MFRRIFNILITIPIGVVLVLFMVANRQWVQVSLDPVNRADPAFAFQAPMFVMMFAALLTGIILGGALVWWKQGQYRRLARREHRDAEMWHKQADEEKARADKHDPAVQGARLAPGLAKLQKA